MTNVGHGSKEVLKNSYLTNPFFYFLTFVYILSFLILRTLHENFPLEMLYKFKITYKYLTLTVFGMRCGVMNSSSISYYINELPFGVHRIFLIFFWWGHE